MSSDYAYVVFETVIQRVHVIPSKMEQSVIDGDTQICGVFSSLDLAVASLPKDVQQNVKPIRSKFFKLSDTWEYTSGTAGFTYIIVRKYYTRKATSNSSDSD
jgi:hypothetical protein